jgi:hypothetical protein
MDIVFDAPNMAVPVGTVAGTQLAASFQFPDPGLRRQVASCPEHPAAPRHPATSRTNGPVGSIRNV